MSSYPGLVGGGPSGGGGSRAGAGSQVGGGPGGGLPYSPSGAFSGAIHSRVGAALKISLRK